MKIRLFALAAASFVGVFTCSAQFADSIVSYDPGTGFSSGFTNAPVVLGAPSTINPFGEATDVFDPPYGTNQIISIGAGGSLVVRFASPVTNSPANRFGIDFNIFGNSGFIITNEFDLNTFTWVGTPATDGSLFAQNEGETRVSVSQDGTNFFQLDPAHAPTVDVLYPTDGAGNPQAPVNPALTASSFAGMTMADIAVAYNGAAGGAGFDITWAQDSLGNPVSLPWIRFVRIDVVTGKAEVDALAAIAPPVIVTQPVSQTVTNAGTGVTFTVVATGATSYQWQFNGEDIAGATNSSLTLSDAFTTADAGNYTVIVSGPAGSVTSGVAALNKPMPAGIYSGLFYEEDAIRHKSSGFFTFTLGTSRSFGGKILIDGGSHGLSGKCGSNHQAHIVIPRTGKSTLTVDLQLITANAANEVEGVVTDGSWTAELLGDRNIYGGSNIAPQTGEYTMTLLTDSNGDDSPSYGSYATATVKTNGAVKLAGLLSDKASLSQSTYISKDGFWPLYVPLYKGTGSVLGWITFSPQPTSKLVGSVSWIKTNSYGLYYTNGFTNSLLLLGGSRHP